MFIDSQPGSLLWLLLQNDVIIISLCRCVPGLSESDSLDGE